MSITAGVFQSVMFYFSHFFEEAKKNRERKGQRMNRDADFLESSWQCQTVLPGDHF